MPAWVTEFQATGLAETFIETQAASIAEGLGKKLSPSMTGTRSHAQPSLWGGSRQSH